MPSYLAGFSVCFLCPRPGIQSVVHQDGRVFLYFTIAYQFHCNRNKKHPFIATLSSPNKAFVLTCQKLVSLVTKKSLRSLLPLDYC